MLDAGSRRGGWSGSGRTTCWPYFTQCSIISRLAREQGINVCSQVLVVMTYSLAIVGGSSFREFWSWLPRQVRIQLRQITGHLSVDYPSVDGLGRLSGAHLDGDARLVHYFRWMNVLIFTLFILCFSFCIGEVQAEDPLLASWLVFERYTPYRENVGMNRLLSLRSQPYLYRQDVDGSWC